MKLYVKVLALCLVVSGCCTAAFAQQIRGVNRLPVLIPESAGAGPKDRGVLSNTQLRVLVAADATSSTTAQFNTPATVRSAYKLPSTGGGGAIAIVDAYHYPTALKDFNTFAKQFSLPQETSTTVTASTNRVFQVVYANGRQPASGGNYIASWNLEAALDVQWAHAIAPNAKIYLVEAASASNSDMYLAVLIASRLPGVRQVSMSWGSGEVASELGYDWLFNVYGVVFFGASGDTGGIVSYPASSPNVVACGGTSLNRDANGTFVNETAWSDAGCGASLYESRPLYQSAIAKIVGTKRGTSDIAFVADPNTGVYVYDSTPLWGEQGWWILGGTSAATPALAGVVNLAANAGSGYAVNSQAELTRLYAKLGNTTVFRDVTSGSASSYRASAGWDFVTGLGSPLGLSGK